MAMKVRWNAPKITIRYAHVQTPGESDVYMHSTCTLVIGDDRV